MFYGTIKSDATIDPSYAFSNNFSVESGSGTGTFVVTFNEYLNYSPTIVTTANSSETKGSAITVEYVMATTSSNEHQATFTTTTMSGSQSAAGFSFHARTGQSLVFDASQNETLDLVPQIITFNGNQVLTISTSINGLDGLAQPGTGTYTAFLDKGTVLLGVLESEDGRGKNPMTLSIPQSFEAGKQTWTVTGWTYGGGTGEDGTQWMGSAGAPATYPLALGSASPMTTPETFVIMATCGDQTLTSDPVVRLSNVPPAGLSM